MCGLVPCSSIGCNNCGWPTGSCFVPSGTLAATDVPLGAPQPYYLLMDIELMSAVQADSEVVCRDGSLLVRGEQGDLVSLPLQVDVPRIGICAPFKGAGPVSAELECPAFPTRARYRISIVNATGYPVWP